MKKETPEVLTYLLAPKETADRTDPAELLADLSREQLAGLLTKLLVRVPNLCQWVEAELALPPDSKPGGAMAHRRPPGGVQVYRQRVRSLLRSLEYLRSSRTSWQVRGLTDELAEVRNEAVELLLAGEPEAALKILLAMLEEGREGFSYVDDSNGQLREFLDQLGDLSAEAVLSLPPNRKPRPEFLKNLNRLNRKLKDYGIDGLEVAISAIRLGWKDLPAAASSVGQRLMRVRLNVLERRDDSRPFLALCLKTGEHLRYTFKLCELSRVPEAVAYALKHLTDAESALKLAQHLARLDHLNEALQIGARGLRLSGNKSPLGRWLGPLQAALGRSAQALEAWGASFQDSPSFENYRTVKQAAGTRWSRLKPKALEMLRKSGDLEEYVKVLLFEKQWDAAIQIADQRDAGSGIVRIVADAVIKHRPEWVVRVTIDQTENLLAKIRSKHYSVAADWLQKTKSAYVQLGQTDEWEKYFQKLKEEHRRRPALQSYLARL
ncbi:MAG TPA: hypothetical protein VJ302_31645 [Blastocatellia bacterium]|nr:hypothetical protein [Blastocatellia bacterium]